MYDYTSLLKAIEAGLGLSSPFRPFVGSHYAESRPRLMICGKATKGWLDETYPDWSTATDESSIRFIYEKIIPRKFSSAFWNFCTALSAKVHNLSRAWEPNSDERRKAFESIIWTNVAKIGTVNGNLPDDMLSQQAHLHATILSDELEAHQPDVIVLLTSWYGKDIWWDLLEIDRATIRVEENGILRAPNSYSQQRIWVLRHPQGWKTEERDAAISRIAHDARTRFSIS